MTNIQKDLSQAWDRIADVMKSASLKRFDSQGFHIVRVIPFQTAKS